MEVSHFKVSQETYNQTVQLSRKWLGLITKYQRDAATELSQIYQALTGTIVDEDTVSDAYGILHSSEHVYIYRFGQIHYGNDCNPWPIGDKTLWPWVAAAREPPRMVRDVWNLIFAKLAPYDILACGKVCRQLRDYAHDTRAWKKFAPLSTDWRFFSSLSTQDEPTIVCQFIKILCVPYNYGNGNVVKSMTDDYGHRYQIGQFYLLKGYRKRTYSFHTNGTLGTKKWAASVMREMLVKFLKGCHGDYKRFSHSYSPCKDWEMFTLPLLP